MAWCGRHGGAGFVKARLRMVRFVMAGWDGKARCVMVRCDWLRLGRCGWVCLGTARCG